MRTGLIAGFAVLVVAVIFIIQNAHAANISFLGVHLVLPLAAALFLAAIAGALAMAAAGPARVTQLRQIIRRAQRPTTSSRPGGAEWNRQDHENHRRARPASPQAQGTHPQSWNGQSAADPPAGAPAPADESLEKVSRP